jgi:predicted enzyme related to lactoylglutathione lyase
MIGSTEFNLDNSTRYPKFINDLDDNQGSTMSANGKIIKHKMRGSQVGRFAFILDETIQGLSTHQMHKLHVDLP